MADKAPARPARRADPGARHAVLAVGLCGQTAALLAGVLPLVALPVAVLLLVAAVRLAAGTAHPERLQQIAAGLALVAVLVSLPRLSSGGPAGLRDTLGPLLLCVQLAQAITWTTVRNLQTGLLIGVGLLLLGASYAPDLVVGLPLLAGWVATVLALVLLVRQRALQAADVVAEPGRTEERSTLVAVGALAVAAGLIAFLLVPVPKSSGLQSSLAAAAAAAGGQTQNASGRARTYSADSLDTSVRGTLSEEPVAEVDAASPGLWRNRSYSTWDGRTWSAPDSRVTRLPGSAPYVLLQGVPTRTDDVRLLARDGTIWAPGEVAELDVRGNAFGDVEGDGGFSARRGTDDYAVRTVVQDLTGLEDQEVVADDPALLALPPSTTERTRALAREITAGVDSTPAKVEAIEQWLERNAAYSLDSPVPQDGEDAVDRFLFVDRIGFCEQFAAAEVVLLRAVGIPARFVTGLAYGTDVGGGTRTFRQKDLHAWVEVPYETAGWVASDPTAGAAQAVAAERTFRQGVAAALRAALDATERFPGGHLGLAAALGAAVVVGALWRRRTSRRPEPAVVVAAPDLPVGDASALAAFLRLDRRLAGRRRAPAESLAELTARLGASGDRASALAVVEQECYGATRPDPRAAVDVLDRWEQTSG